MADSASANFTIDEWIARDAISFAADDTTGLNSAVDQVVATIGDSVELLGLGEPMHGWEEILLFRNRVFRRLVVAHGYTAIALESSFPRGWLANEYVAGRGPASFDELQERGFSHGFGRSATNRELVEWMRAYNADPSHGEKLRFYGFDSPTEMTGTDSPRQLLSFALDYVASMDPAGGEARRQRVMELIGADADWENPAVMFDPSKGVGQSAAAVALRIEVEELITEMGIRRPEWVAKGGRDAFSEALRYAAHARTFLTYHAGLAQPGDDRIARLLGVRDVMMAENLAYIVDRERSRGGRVLAFAHNMHLQRGLARWQLGPHALAWWPAGAQVDAMLGGAYAVIGTGVGEFAAQGIGRPETGTLEARLSAGAGRARFVPTRRRRGFDEAKVAEIPTRSGSATNSGYFPLSSQSLSDFDGLVVLG